jgi:AcrR family transcriptional regulator
MVRENKLQQRRHATRARLLDAAFTVFARHGYAGTSVDAIARVAGHSKGAFYYHFASKESIFLELLNTYVLPTGPDRPAGEEAERRRQVLSALLLEFWTHALRNEQIKEGLRALYQSRLHDLVSQFGATASSTKAVTEVCRALIALEDGLLVQEVIGLPQTSGERATFVRRLLHAYVLATDESEGPSPAPRPGRRSHPDS